MSLRGLSRASVVSLLLVGGWIALSAPTIWGQEEINRKVRTKVAPIYPDLARHMNITGVVKVVVTVTPEWDGERGKAGGRASGAGECGFGCGKEMAVRAGRARVDGSGGIPF